MKRLNRRSPPSLNQLKRMGNKQMAEAHLVVAQAAELAKEVRRVRSAIVENHNEPLPFRGISLLAAEVEGT